jgi:uncharacterized membrane protein
MIEYLTKAWATFLIGFVTVAEIYVAVPAGMAMGLDPISAVAWSVAGNWAPIPLLHLMYDQLRTVPRLGKSLERLSSERARERVERGGLWFYLLITPMIGTWAIGVTVKVLKVPATKFIVPSFISVLIFGIVIAAALAMGIRLVS